MSVSVGDRYRSSEAPWLRLCSFYHCCLSSFLFPTVFLSLGREWAVCRDWRLPSPHLFLSRYPSLSFPPYVCLFLLFLALSVDLSLVVLSLCYFLSLPTALRIRLSICLFLSTPPICLFRSLSFVSFTPSVCLFFLLPRHFRSVVVGAVVSLGQRNRQRDWRW